MLAVVVGLVLGAVGVAIDRDSRAPDGDNPIVIENRRPGAVGWRLGIDEAAIGPSVGDDDVLAAGTPVPESDSGGPGLVPRAAPTPWVSLNAIEGYTGAQSINRGQPVSLHVSSRSATFDVRVYRQGWYGGAGATQVWTASAIAGVARPLPVATATGRIEAAWPVSLTIPGSVTGGWASGVYLAGLYPAGSSSVSSFIPFVVRDDARTAEILYVLPTTTWQAYNGWGGKSMYAFNSQNDVPATEVSFDRPYATNAGTGLYLGTDVTMVRFLEREGYDVKYVASVDLESRPANLLSSFGTLLTTWHDEYHSAAMRGTVVAARDAGRSATVDIEATPARAGYWLLDEVGGVHAFGDALDLGDGALSAEQVRRGERFTALSSTPTGKGYWLFTNRGRVVNVGDAGHFGDVSHLSLNGPVLGSIATPTGAGYSLVASDGGIFAFGDAPFLGSVGDRILNAPVRSHVPTPTNRGYWLVASDGGIFAFGDAGFRGSVPGVLRSGQALNAPIVGMVRYGDGYLMVASDGGIFSFSSSPFAGSLADTPPSHAVVAVAAVI